jgi:Protein of unknown function (DUF3455)
MTHRSLVVFAVASLLPVLLPSNAGAQGPNAIAVAPGEAPILTVHAEGAQIYECKADSSGNLVWQFREPIASLFVDGKTVGRHYAGPNWELTDGSAVTAKVAGRAPGATPKDIPLLKLEVTSRRGRGQTLQCHGNPEDQHQGGHGRRGVRSRGFLPERAVFCGLHLSHQGRVIRSANCRCVMPPDLRWRRPRRVGAASCQCLAR